MDNSPLVDFTLLSPNCSRRHGKIKKITIHHAAGITTVEFLGSEFASPERGASATYGIDNSGRVGQYVDERNAPWTSNSYDNDNQAVTIEVANDEIGGLWHVSDIALAKLIDLCTDVCIRNKIKRLNYTGDASGNLTRHNMFAATACPGEYLQSKFSYIAEEVNKRLEKRKPMTTQEKKAFEELEKKVDKLKADLDTCFEKYNWTTACPEWAQTTVHKLLSKGILKGRDDGQLYLSEQMIRILVMLDRAGDFDRESTND